MHFANIKFVLYNKDEIELLNTKLSIADKIKSKN